MTKKKNRRVRKQIRKTLGALFMASAIVVAAVPVDDVSAQPGVTATPEAKVWVWDSTQSNSSSTSNGERPSGSPSGLIADYCESTIPYVPDDAIIYTSGDGRFQFAYVDPGSGVKAAVILNYNANVLADSTLTIPNTMEAFRKYKTTSTEGYYCLVTQNDEFMFYDIYEQDTDEYGRLLFLVPEIKYDNDKHKVPDGDTKHKVGDSIEVNYDQLVTRDGKHVYVETETNQETGLEEEVIYQVEELMVTHQKPCYYEQRSLWGDKDDSELYYQVKDSVTSDNPDGTLVHPADQMHYRIDASVKYIGQQFVEVTTDSDGNLSGWKVKSGSYRSGINDGVFANNANITNLIIGENLSGISDYAFQGCSTLRSVTFGNNLTTVGNGAFANCIRLSECNMPDNSNIQALGKDAFYGCTGLTSFTMPINVKAIGDSCFEGCTRLQTIDLCGEGELDTRLQTIGNSAFKGCTSLTSLVFPSQYDEEDLQIAVFEGCSSLQFVKVPSSSMNFVDTTGYTFADFKKDVPESFYFWGADTKSDDRSARSALHITANDNEITYKYWDKQLYEVVILEDESNPDQSPKITYQVNDQNVLEKIWLENNPKNVEIPKQVGPYGISSIGTGCFDDACSIEKVTIPSTVNTIASEAFKGSHNINTIIFEDASTIQSIGEDAFLTQANSCNCKIDDKDPELIFVGAMMNEAGEDTVPFMYAMNGESNINNANQNKSWIICHSGWPTNIEVRYNYDVTTQTGEAQLVGYPRYEELKNNAADWVNDLPYATTDAEKSEYLEMVQNAVSKYEDKTGTDNEVAIVTSTLNLAIPASVDSIKPGLFSGYTYDEDGNPEPVSGITPDKYIQTILINGVNTIEPYTFKDCTALKSAEIIGSEYIDNYAFDDCTSLESVTLGTNLTDTGLRPFRGCENLTRINCLDTDFSYNNGVLYRNTESGTEIVECLEGRGKKVGSFTVGPDELAGVTAIKEEAFADCDEIGKVDLSSTTVDVIPVSCFEDTDTINSVVLPDTVKSIESDAFRNSAIRLLTIPGTQSYIAQDAFMNGDWLTKPSDRETDPGNTEQQTIIFECIEGTTADRYAKEYWYINPEYGKVYLEHTVYFWDYPNYPDTTEKSLFYKVKVKDGEDAVPPTESPSHDGYVFSRWTDYTNISRDTDVYPVYGNNVYAVKFVDYDGTLLCDVQYIEEGKSAVPPADPVREGYTFDKWSQDWNNVTEDRTIIALYIDNSSDASRHTVIFYDYDGVTELSKQSVNHGEAAVEPKSPTRSGYKFIGWVPADFSNVVKDMNIVANYEKKTSSGSDSSSTASPSPTSTSSSDSSSSDSSSSTKTYTVSVSGGSGSGSYPAGAIVAINAYYLGSGQNFDKWTTSTAGVGFANASASSTTFTMPAANVAITATYKTGSSSVSYGGSSTGSGSGSSTASGNNSGSSVQVTNPGISNTNLAGATVSGATDNFIVKVTEDQNATNQVVAALQARYGDITRIKYLAMDISLYDSTGRTKIADTSGISVNLTLPIPDDLVQYAGNNKVAAVVNGSLQDLNGRFTTVDGVPCLNFTATHFSPYVIYVDTANLTAGTIDATPKTGDPIHPKWFLAIGMACISLILFFKRDKAVIPAKTV